MSEMANLEARLADLESHLAHQNETVTGLSDVVTEQWQQIDRLTRQVAHLIERLSLAEEALEKTQGPAHQRPPHY